jgi:hypothetical protein
MVDPGGSPLEWALFAGVSLRASDGPTRPVYDAWRELSLQP